jgi:hypothetical protein
MGFSFVAASALPIASPRVTMFPYWYKRERVTFSARFWTQFSILLHEARQEQGSGKESALPFAPPAHPLRASIVFAFRPCHTDGLKIHPANLLLEVSSAQAARNHAVGRTDAE